MINPSLIREEQKCIHKDALLIKDDDEYAELQISISQSSSIWITTPVILPSTKIGAELILIIFTSISLLSNYIIYIRYICILLFSIQYYYYCSCCMNIDPFYYRLYMNTLVHVRVLRYY